MLKTDCKHFHGDRPCQPHKEKGIKCDNCTFYQPVKFKILIIKLDAVGDVLRTTSLLKPLRKNYPDSNITWCTRQSSKELFKYNSFIDDVIVIEDDAYFRIKAEEFDLVINLDTSKISSSVASIAMGKRKKGFILNNMGYVEATSEYAQKWLEMSAFDDVKKANTKPYQQLMYEILELNFPIERPLLPFTDEERNKIQEREFYKNINHDLPVLGLNIGVGTKWPSKGWPLTSWQDLIKRLGNKNYNIILLSGPEETWMASQLKDKYNFLIDTGCDNSLLEFAAIVDLCDLVITADTLALHISTALDKKIIALFGPTSATEIELYGNGDKLSSTDGCKCYYRKYCSEEISCMEKITIDMVIKAINSLL